MKKNLSYLNEWEIKENSFDDRWLNKYEAIMAQGNGYLGIRASTEESYIGEIRNFFVSGTFNRFSEEVTELPNIPDVLGMRIQINGEELILNRGTVEKYNRTINFQNGELVRSFVWHSVQGNQVLFRFRRCVSMDELHFVKQEIMILPLSNDIKVSVESGINGRLTNSGTQHFDELEKRKKGSLLQMNVRTIESKVEMAISTKHNVYLNEKEIEVKKHPSISRRKIMESFELVVKKDQEIIIEKTSSVFTSRDFDFLKSEDLGLRATHLSNEMTDRYNDFLKKSQLKWNRIYRDIPIEIISKQFTDQLLLNFSRYHLHIMTHPNDARVNIGAKGLTGEGYKGHTFWDTDIFILPYFTFSYPEIAQNLVEYRFKTLKGARKKARNNSYLGAQIPWESAWLDDGETTPLYGDVDIVTGKSTKILTGLIEDHVSSDVIYGFKQFLDVTGRKNKEVEYQQLVLETALFWISRAERNTEGQLEILDVIGPDEYKEHVNNNTYTNTMAKFNVDQALIVLDDVTEEDYQKWQVFLNNMTKEELRLALLDFSQNIFIYGINNQGILPQDDDYLAKKNLDISRYKESSQVNEIFKEYNLEQVNQFQVSKQADVLLLMTHFFDKFSEEEVMDNFEYYEARTLHDSSLSLSTHSILASLLKKRELAYDFYSKLQGIDLGQNMFSSDQGIHSASMGGVWQAVVLGFGGLRYDVEADCLHIDPNLPDQWTGLKYAIFFKGQKLEISINKQVLLVKLIEGVKPVVFYHQGKRHLTDEQIKS